MPLQILDLSLILITYGGKHLELGLNIHLLREAEESVTHMPIHLRGEQMDQPDEFVTRFMDRRRAERYRDRYRTGRHARINEREHAALRELLNGRGRFEVALDLPCGAGRLADVLTERSDRVILADSSQLMLDIAREDLGEAKYSYLQTNAESIDMPDASVDLVFCHRLLNHVNDADSRARMVMELARVTRRYLAFSCYPPGIRTRLKNLLRRFVPGRPAQSTPTLREYLHLAAHSGLRPVRREVVRRLPFAAELVLLEKQSVPQ